MGIFFLYQVPPPNPTLTKQLHKNLIHVHIHTMTYTSEYPFRVTIQDWYGSSTHLLGISSNCGFFISSILVSESCSLILRSLISRLCFSISCFFSLAAENPSVVHERAWIRRPLPINTQMLITIHVYRSYISLITLYNVHIQSVLEILCSES